MRVITGLGCPDWLIPGAPTLDGQITSHPDWTFSWASASYTNLNPVRIYIQSFDCDSVDLAGYYFRIATIAHEVGHGLHFVGTTLSTRNAFVQFFCTLEGKAVLNNLTARSELLATSLGYYDIGVAASNGPGLIALAEAGGDNLDQHVGTLFCDNNVTSTTGESYNDFYGRIYDEAIAARP
ncbi:hypothetical protein SRABI35_04006 [Stenotrophomonas lactitubi]|nr:hypothetical protein SRABI35_04006 [Stenotrophomonas lactitubi]